MSPSDHADFDALSAYVDGEAPEWADHVAACARCRASAARLRAVAAEVGRVDPPPAAARDRAITAALDSLPVVGVPAQPVGDGHDAERARFARRRTLQPWAMPAVAAVVVGLLGLSGFVLSANRASKETTVAGRALESAPKADSGGVAAASPPIPTTDLGDVADPAALLNRARTGYSVAPGRAASSSNSGAASDATATSGASGGAAASGATGGPGGGGGALSGANAQVGPPTTNLNQRTPAAVVVGTRLCEEQARVREPGLGPVVYFATARKDGVAGVVLGFGQAGGPPTPVTLLLLAQDGCRELLRAAGP